MASSYSTKGQLWSLDFIIGVLIFLVTVVFFFVQMNSLELTPQTSLNRLVLEAQDISTTLMSEGYPPAWTASTVVVPGIVTDARVNSSRLNELVLLNYSVLQGLLRVSDEFFVFIEQGNGCVLPLDGRYGVGNPLVSVPASGCVAPTSVNVNPASPETVVPITRYVIYNATPARLHVYVWNS